MKTLLRTILMALIASTSARSEPTAPGHAAMSLSSVSVISNALRLRRVKL